MHQTLRTPEVLVIICLQIYPDRDHEPSQDASRVLVRLARTCKLFSEPALDALWSFQSTIFGILDCMPSGVWKQSDRSLRRPILQTDWDRPIFYMHRVRVFSCLDGSFPSCLDLPVVFENLRCSLPTESLFPNLRTLSWSFTSSSLFSLVSLFFGPRLTRISLGTFQSIPHLTLLSALAVKCPLLTDTKLIQSEIRDAHQSQTVSAFVRGLNRIQSLDVAHLDETAFEHIAHLPASRTLTLQAPHIFETSLPSPMLTDPNFVTLQHLELRAASSQCILGFIRAMSDSSLLSVLLDIKPPGILSTAKIYSALKRHVPRASLAVLSITSGPAPHAHAISSDTLRLLFCFTSLTFVVLRPPNGFDIDDNAVQAMAEAWPLVEYFSLRSRSGTHPLRTTLRSLLSLATHCRRLTRLEISLDASTVPGVDLSVPVRVVQFALSEVEVADSLLVSALLVARFLSGVFPSLTNICTKRQDGRNHPGSTAGALKARSRKCFWCAMRCEMRSSTGRKRRATAGTGRRSFRSATWVGWVCS